ncbi:transcription factor bHLH118-like [Cucumis sativus]|uniref:BHLH transcription factor n=1 Tax=Cucumis sativus TaxID=3659 RepID=A0A097IYP0_CUCSA|nr:transcription factor bHLH118-like [Cucumis sativus]AIT72027.1 bHLH transcription factor [Cucumis sativus]
MDLDCIQSPFPFDQVDELFPLPSLSPIHLSVADHPPLIASINNTNRNISEKPKKGRRRKSPNTSADIEDENPNPNEHKKKKIIHRDVERQRRQEMSTLYAALRSLLPVEYLKGKRSICDHMHETVKYIQHMQTKIQMLRNKRDELKKNIEDGEDSGNITTIETLNSSKRDSVLVMPRSCGGVQILLDTATHHRLPLSNLIKFLITQNLQIISCHSTRKNDRFLHTIETEAAVDVETIDMSELQNKLTNLEYFPLD